MKIAKLQDGIVDPLAFKTAIQGVILSITDMMNGVLIDQLSAGMAGNLSHYVLPEPAFDKASLKKIQSY